METTRRTQYEYEKISRESYDIIERLAFYLCALEESHFFFNKRIKYNPESRCDFNRLDEDDIIAIYFYCEDGLNDEICGFELFQRSYYDWLIIRIFDNGIWRAQKAVRLNIDCAIALQRLVEIHQRINEIERCEIDEDTVKIESDDKRLSFSCVPYDEDELVYFEHNYDDLDLIALSSPYLGTITLFKNNDAFYLTNLINFE